MDTRKVVNSTRRYVLGVGGRQSRGNGLRSIIFQLTTSFIAEHRIVNQNVDATTRGVHRTTTPGWCCDIAQRGSRSTTSSPSKHQLLGEPTRRQVLKRGRESTRRLRRRHLRCSEIPPPPLLLLSTTSLFLKNCKPICMARRTRR